ncbi:MAG TPA: hypothetical protein VNB94_04180 [Mycobacteriales bacterium]|nr:hypothetical protein [Mycobacteriales bacterium]
MATSSRIATRRVLTVLALAGATGIAPLAGSAFAAPAVPAPGTTQGGSTSNPDGGGVDKPFPVGDLAAGSQGTDDFDGNNGCGNDDDREDDNNGLCGGPKKDKDKDKDKDDADTVVTPVSAPVVTVSTPVTLTAPRSAVTTTFGGVVFDGTVTNPPVPARPPVAAPAPAVQKAPAATKRAPAARKAPAAKAARRIQPAGVLGARIVRPAAAPEPASVLGVQLSRSFTAPAPAQVLGAAQVAGAVLPRTGNGVPLQLAFLVGGLMVVAGGTSLSVGRARQ